MTEPIAAIGEVRWPVKWMMAVMRSRWRLAGPLLTWLLIRLMPMPSGLDASAWHYFALFAAVIVALILEPIPSAAVGLIGVTAATVIGYVASDPNGAVGWALTGFSNRTVWLIFGAYTLSIGYERSGLGRRVGLILIKHLGGRTLGLGYAIALADLVTAPGTPSNTARSAGIIYPIVRNIPELFGSRPGPTARRIGAYIMWTAFATTAVTSSLFLTALAPNPLAISMVQQATDVQITWRQWFLGFLPIGGPLFLLVPLITYWVYPPEIKRSADVPAWASRQLQAMGAIRREELSMAVLVVLALLLWIAGRAYVHSTTVVLILLSLMVVAGIVRWDDVLAYKPAWNALIWFATLVTLADGLNRVGFVDWIAVTVASSLTHVAPTVVMAGLVAAFFLLHYLFASLTAHTMAVFPVFLAIGQGIPGVPVLPFALLLGYSIGLMGVITPYATGPAPVYYGSGYISHAEFWKLGLLFGVIFLTALLAIGIPFLTHAPLF